MISVFTDFLLHDVILELQILYPMASYFPFLDNINDNHGEASKELGKIGGRFNVNYSSGNTTKGKLQPYKLLHERLVRKIAAIK